SRRRHTRFSRDWSSDVCSSDLACGRQKLLVGLQLFHVKRQAGRTTTKRLGSSPLDSLTRPAAATASWTTLRSNGVIGGSETASRSEERRVGKEWRARRAPAQYK